MLKTIVPWVLGGYVIVLGVALGAGLYELRIEVPRWLVTLPDGSYHWNRAAAVEADVGRRFWALVTTGPLTLLTLAGLILAWYAPAPVRTWWLVALGATLIDRGMTFGYFIPTMIQLGREGVLTDGEAAAKALTWAQLSWVRMAASAVAVVAALRAFGQSWQGPSAGA